MCSHKNKILKYATKCRPAMPTLGRMRQENHEFKANLGYIVSPPKMEMNCWAEL
jgi:hypothetical protein